MPEGDAPRKPTPGRTRSRPASGRAVAPRRRSDAPESASEAKPRELTWQETPAYDSLVTQSGDPFKDAETIAKDGDELRQMITEAKDSVSNVTFEALP